MPPTIGDHLVAPGPLCAHHGLYIGDDRVIHYPGVDEAMRPRPIEETTLQQFAQGRQIHIKPHGQRTFDGPTAVARSRRRIGENGYHMLANNCEQFVNWCIDGDHRSDQVQNGVALAGCGMTIGAAAGSRAAVSRVGKVQGLSASGVMSGLGAIGDTVGLGTAGGLATVATVTAGAATWLAAGALLPDNPAQDPHEREARRHGRRAGYITAGISIPLVLVLISELGSVKGLGATGVSSGLSTLGRTLGGGMGAGVGVAAAIPVVLVIIAALVIYGISKGPDHRSQPIANS